MKHFIFLSLLMQAMFVSAQQTGSIISKQTFPKAGTENTYTYSPPKGLIIPEKAQAEVIYLEKPFFKIKKFSLQKNGDAYAFSFTTPDSTQAFVAAIVDEKSKVIDNNNEQGYLITLYDNNNKKFPLTDIAYATLERTGSSHLGLKVSAKNILTFYENAFKEDSSAKEKYYYFYLTFLYTNNKEEGKPKLIDYAQTLLASNEEPKWISAYYIYRVLGMFDEQKQTEAKILTAYPTGEFAKQQAQTDFRTAKEPDSMITKMDAYYKKFNDSATETRDNFYFSIISAYANKKDWANFYKYSNLISDKNKLHNLYNSTAWKLSGESLSTPGTDLETAKDISSRSLNFIQNIINNPAKYSSYYHFFDADFADGMNTMYNAYLDTYALIQYKLGNYDSAFYYQQIADKDVAATGADGLERYCAYAEKVKGADFIKNFLEEQIVSGKGTPAMKAQLKSIYEKNNLPEAGYDKVIAQAENNAKEKMLQGIKEKLKNYQAPDFSLKNLQGETVSLTSLKGKVVVVDFWATWCGPCKASFPAMQTALNKYKNDNDVAFVFVDTWEHKDPAKMKEDAAQFIKDNNYTFNVALDEKDKIVTDYDVEGIPTKFVVDRKGNVKYMSVGFEGNADDLVAELSLMIEDAKK